PARGTEGGVRGCRRSTGSAPSGQSPPPRLWGDRGVQGFTASDSLSRRSLRGACRSRDAAVDRSRSGARQWFSGPATRVDGRLLTLEWKLFRSVRSCLTENAAKAGQSTDRSPRNGEGSEPSARSAAPLALITGPSPGRAGRTGIVRAPARR